MGNHMKRKKNMILCIFVVLLILILSSQSYVSISNSIQEKSVSRFQTTLQKVKETMESSDNTPPNPPDITGPTNGKINEAQKYIFTLTDPDENQLIRLEINFGDETLEERCGCDKPWYNGTVLDIDHTWRESGTYNLTARVSDEYGAWSEWSDPLPVTMPYTHIASKQQSNEYINISAQEAWDLMNNTEDGRKIPIDMRRPGEYFNERIVPPHPEDWPRWFPYEIQSDGPGPIKNEGILLDLFISHYKDKEIIIYCRTGRRTDLAAQILIDNGFQGKLYNMVDGITEWKAEGLPTTLTN